VGNLDNLTTIVKDTLENKITLGLTNALVSATVSSAVNQTGTKGFVQSFTNSIVDSIGREITQMIGAEFGGANEDQYYWEHKIAHAITGCLVARAKSQSCEAGALGATTSAFISGYIDKTFGQLFGATGSTGNRAATEGMLTAITGMLARVTNQDIDTAIGAAQMEYENNYLKHFELAERNQAAARCKLGVTASCDRVKELDTLSELRNQALVDGCLVATSAGCKVITSQVMKDIGDLTLYISELEKYKDKAKEDGNFAEYTRVNELVREAQRHIKQALVVAITNLEWMKEKHPNEFTRDMDLLRHELQIIKGGGDIAAVWGQSGYNFSRVTGGVDAIRGWLNRLRGTIEKHPLGLDPTITPQLSEIKNPDGTLSVCIGGVCARPGMCFVEGTPVLTPQGLRAIEDIRPGDLVVSKNEVTGEVSANPVEFLVRNRDQEILDITLKGTLKSETLGVTAEHPFRAINNTWVKAGELRPGDEVQDINGRIVVVVSVVGRTQRENTYNFSVHKDHTYAVGENAVWVHNSDKCVRGEEMRPFNGPPGSDKAIYFLAGDSNKLLAYRVHGPRGSDDALVTLNPTGPNAQRLLAEEANTLNLLAAEGVPVVKNYGVTQDDKGRYAMVMDRVDQGVMLRSDSTEAELSRALNRVDAKDLPQLIADLSAIRNAAQRYEFNDFQVIVGKDPNQSGGWRVRIMDPTNNVDMRPTLVKGRTSSDELIAIDKLLNRANRKLNGK
jgi:hypothetical protein